MNKLQFLQYLYWDLEVCTLKRVYIYIYEVIRFLKGYKCINHDKIFVLHVFSKTNYNSNFWAACMKLLVW